MQIPPDVVDLKSPNWLARFLLTAAIVVGVVFVLDGLADEMAETGCGGG